MSQAPADYETGEDDKKGKTFNFVPADDKSGDEVKRNDPGVNFMSAMPADEDG